MKQLGFDDSIRRKLVKVLRFQHACHHRSMQARKLWKLHWFHCNYGFHPPPPRKEWAYLTSTFSNQKQDRRNLRVALRSQNGRKFPSLFAPVAMAMGSHSSLNLRIWNPWISYWRRLWTWKSQTLVQARRKPTDATDTTRKKHGRKKTCLIFWGEGVAGNDVFKTSEFFFGRWMIPFLHRIHGRTVNILVHTFPFTIQMLSILLEPTVIYMVITSTCRINMDILWLFML